MPKKKNRGGRKPVDPSERIILVGFYVKRSIVDAVGGMDSARLIAQAALTESVTLKEYEDAIGAADAPFLVPRGDVK